VSGLGKLFAYRKLDDEELDGSTRRNRPPTRCCWSWDASTGQNALNQAVQFYEAVGVTSLILTKLDGAAKGGYPLK